MLDNWRFHYIGNKVKVLLGGGVFQEGVICGVIGEEWLIDLGNGRLKRCSDRFIEIPSGNLVCTVSLRIDEMSELSSYNRGMSTAYPVSSYETRAMSGKTFGEHAKERAARARWFSDALNYVWPK